MLKREPRDDEPRTDAGTIPLRTMFLAVVLASLLSGVAVAAVDRLALGAPAGPQGVAGPAGDAGEVDAEQVWDAIETDPARLADQLDPSPSDLGDRLDELADGVDQASSDAEQVKGDLDSLCSSLTLTGALADEILSCP